MPARNFSYDNRAFTVPFPVFKSFLTGGEFAGFMRQCKKLLDEYYNISESDQQARGREERNLTENRGSHKGDQGNSLYSEEEEEKGSLFVPKKYPWPQEKGRDPGSETPPEKMKRKEEYPDDEVVKSLEEKADEQYLGMKE